MKNKKTIPDYLGDPQAAKDLARRLTMYYTKQGFHNVRFWVIREEISRGKFIYSVRCNGRMPVPTITR